MRRVPEAELMDEPEQALAYALADFSEPHNHFVELFRQYCADPLSSTVLDLGCGPGDICRRFARAFPDCLIHAVDASEPMLELGRRANREAQLDDRISCFQGYLPGARLPHPDYQTILSSSLLHHLAEPGTLWDSLYRFGRPGTQLFVMDLVRPDSARQADRLVEQYAGDESDILKTDFRNSLGAAYTAVEIDAQLQMHGLHYLNLEVVSDRHFIVHGRLRRTSG